MKKLKLLFVLLIIIMVGAFLCNSVNAATGDQKKLKIIHERPLETVGQKYTLRIPTAPDGQGVFKIVGADGNYDDILYCLRSGLGFGSTTGGEISNLIYTETFNLKTDATNVMNYFRSTSSIGYSIRDAEYNAILWIADNMYLPGKR